MIVVKVLSVVFPVFFLIILGYLFASYKKVSLEPVINILLYLTVPALVIYSLSDEKILLWDLGLITLAVVCVILGTGVISYLYLSAVNKAELRGFYLATMFMNSGNMALPLAFLAFGRDGLRVAILYYIAVSLMVYSLGVFIAKGKGGGGEIFKLPLIYAALIAIVLNLLDLRLPGPVLTSMGVLGAATLPLMQISLGYRLYSARLTHINMSIAGSIIRIGGGVAIAYLFVTLLGIEGLNKKIILLASAMPSAVISFIMSQRYELQSELVASCVATSTLLSVVTTPILLVWLI